MWLGLFAIAMTLAYTAFRYMPVKWPELQGPRLRGWRLLATLGVLFGMFNYYNFSGPWLRGLDDYTDAAYYYLNSKYFDELGYTKLYEAMLLADQEGPAEVTPNLSRVRDLVTYEIVPIRQVLAEGPPVSESFTPERWAAFSHDANWFLARKLEIRNGLDNLRNNFFVDHGYNPPPAWTLVGGNLANLVPVEHVKLLTSLDGVLVVALFGGIAWAFGPDVFLLAALWWLCTFSGRWPVITHSYLRFDWVVALGLAVCALKKERHATAGALLAWSTSTRVFPAIFIVPVVAQMAWDAWRTRSVPRATRRFVAGVALTGIVVNGLAWVDVGTDGMVGGAKKVLLHNNDPGAYSSQKVGLGDALFFRGETSEKQMRRTPCAEWEKALWPECVTHNHVHGKAELIHAVGPGLKVVGVLGLLAVIGWSIRTRAPLHDLPALGFVPLFCMTTPSYYYFTMRIVLVLWHLQDLRRPRNLVGLLLLLGLEVLSHWTKLQRYPRYTTTATISWGLLLYFTVMGALLAWEAWGRPREQSEPAMSG